MIEAVIVWDNWFIDGMMMDITDDLVMDRLPMIPY